MLRALIMARCSIPLHWVSVDGGQLALGGRPRIRAFARLAADGCTHVLTLQSEHEDAAAIGHAAGLAGLTWLWLPFAHGQPPLPSRDVEIAAMLEQVAAALAGGARILIHCAAGIHRTGMVTYALLRWVGLDAEAAHRRLADLRAVTAEGVGPARIAWAERMLVR
jgi:protein-tyrosine phosphatase